MAFPSYRPPPGNPPPPSELESHGLPEGPSYGGGGGGLSQATVVLTHAQLLAFEVPVPLITTLPGATNLIVVSQVLVLAHIVTAYAGLANGATIYVRYKADNPYGRIIATLAADSTGSDAFRLVLETEGDHWTRLIVPRSRCGEGQSENGSYDPADSLSVSVNQGLAVVPQCEGATGGNAANTLRFVVTYNVLDITTGVLT